jgi:hypothetical protein
MTPRGHALENALAPATVAHGGEVDGLPREPTCQNSGENCTHAGRLPARETETREPLCAANKRAEVLGRPLTRTRFPKVHDRGNGSVNTCLLVARRRWQRSTFLLIQEIRFVEPFDRV